MKIAMITGITGQDGAYLSKFLLSKGYNIIGVLRKNKKFNLKNLEYLGVSNKINFIEMDLLDLPFIIKILENNNIDEIYNFAAQSSVGLSFNIPLETINFNIISTTNLLEAIRIVNPKIKYYQASSSEMFGNVEKQNLPINETTAFHPISPYGTSKAASHWITVNYREIYNMFAVCGICFNHESVLRGYNFVTKKITDTAVKISMGFTNEIKLGNLKIFRDWGYAPNYVEVMWLMLQQDTPEDYVISSGEAHSLEEFAKKVFEKLKLDIEKFIRIDRNLYRPTDLKINYGDNSKAKNKLNWNYNMNFEQLINRLVDDELKYFDWKIKQNNKSINDLKISK
ncbi:MAG: GDP-mannose 4,6-dehydratase [Actinobacteria bacterium]|nr:GDP-mannose 4,6-dehydratase [Actinomycetota bacterium]